MHSKDTESCSTYLWSVFMFNKRWCLGEDVNWHCCPNVWIIINSTFVIFVIFEYRTFDVLQHSPNYYMVFYFLIPRPDNVPMSERSELNPTLSTTDSQPLCWLYMFPVQRHRNWTRNMCFILPQARHNDVDCALLPYVNDIHLGVLYIILCLLCLDHRYCSMSMSYSHIVQGYFTDPVTILWLP